MPSATTPIVPGSGKTGLYGTDFVADSRTDHDGSMAVIGWNVSGGVLELGSDVRFQWTNNEPTISSAAHPLTQPFWTAPYTEIWGSLCRVADSTGFRCSKYMPTLDSLAPDQNKQLEMEYPAPEYLSKYLQRFKNISNLECFRYIMLVTPHVGAPPRENIHLQCIHSGDVVQYPKRRELFKELLSINK